MAQTYCPLCGKKAFNNDTKCSICGAPIHTHTAPKNNTPTAVQQPVNKPAPTNVPAPQTVTQSQRAAVPTQIQNPQQRPHNPNTVTPINNTGNQTPPQPPRRKKWIIFPIIGGALIITFILFCFMIGMIDYL